jgi:hypothetical protein
MWNNPCLKVREFDRWAIRAMQGDLHCDRIPPLLLEVNILNTTRTKRWNGKIETLKADYLNDVIARMETYGDRVQFGLKSAGQRPNYQVINTDGKKMGFDSGNHLLTASDDEFDASNVSAVYTLDQVKLALAGGGSKASTTTRASRAGAGATRTTTAATRAKDQAAEEKYEYYKNNRKTLPPSIGEHSDEISDLMTKGMSAEQAFGEVVKRHF